MIHGQSIRTPPTSSAGQNPPAGAVLAAALFGSDAVHNGSTADPPPWPATSTEFMHARYFSPNLGRFLSPDPVTDAKRAIARPQMWNKYTYSLNNPVSNIDRDGRETGSVTNSAEWGLHPGGPLPLRQEAAMWAAVTLVGAASYAAVGGGAALLPFATTAALSPQGQQLAQAGLELANPSPGQLGRTAVAGFAGDIVGSSRAVRGQITEGARAITKKLGHAESQGMKSAFEGIAATQENAEELITGILSSPQSVVAGEKTIDVFNAAGQGVRFDKETKQFIGFLEGELWSR